MSDDAGDDDRLVSYYYNFEYRIVNIWLQFSTSGFLSVFLENTSDLAVIRELYNNGAHELYENELERALDKTCETIVIEPTRLGEETARWIMIGDCLRKTASLSGFGSIVGGFVWPDKPFIYCPMATISLLSTGIHLSWQFDSCYNYKVESDMKKLVLNNIASADTPTAVVLVKRSNYEIRKNSFLHTAISLIAFAFSAWKLYKCLKFAVI